jgi:hypothetical protein
MLRLHTIRQAILWLLLAACMGMASNSTARAATCSLSNCTASYATGQDSVGFTLDASASTSGATVSFYVTAIPVYLDSGGHVLSSGYSFTAGSGGGNCYPSFHLVVNMSPSPRSNFVFYAPTGAVSYTYSYHISASVWVNGVVVISGHCDPLPACGTILL